MKISERRAEMGEEKWTEYQRERNNAKSNKYKRSNADKVVNWRRRAKIKLIHYLGDKCQICGYDKPIPSAYAFHHRDPSTKKFTISGKTLSFEKLKKEADKCDLLCRNCHAELHDEDYKKQREGSIEKWEKEQLIRIENDKKKNDKECPNCKKKFKGKVVESVYCSLECCEVGRRKVKNRPSKKQLLEEIEETNYCAVGRKYGVSDNAIRKWLK